MRKTTSGFTIVELLIVVVVIAILAAISIIAYNGVQQRARDTERMAELTSLQKALEIYHAEKGGYPLCGSTSGPNLTPILSSGTAYDCLVDELVPGYTSAIPADPTNNGSYVYRYAPGYKKNGTTSYAGGTATDNYILGTKQETVSTPTYGGWGFSDLTLLLGSAN